MKTITTDWIASMLGSAPVPSHPITSIVIDTRKVLPGCLFVCIKGERFDGNDFAQSAVDAGAAAVLCNESAVCSGLCIRVADTRAAFLKLSACYRALFAIPVVGLTGSVGKTTTKEMTHLVLSGKYRTLKTLGNFNNEIGMPQTLFRLEEGTQAAVIEMGMSHAGEIRALSMASQPTVGVITNIGLSHIENLGSQENIFAAKMELVEGLLPEAPLVLNADDCFLSTVPSTASHKVYTYGIENGDFKAYNIEEKGLQTSFSISFFGIQQQVVLPTVGRHNVYDALAAFAVGYLLGVEPQAAADQLAGYVPDGMRQKCVEINGILSIEDCYNAAPDSMKAAVTALMALKAHKRFAVLADMLELGDYSARAHYDVGQMVAGAGVDGLLAYGDQAREYVNGAKEMGFTNAFFFQTKEALCDALYSMISAGDAVVFKGSRGMKLEEVIHAFYEKWGK